MNEQSVWFGSGDHRLAGVLYRPDAAADPAPGIVLCQGYTGTKEMFLPILAQAFCEAGYACLIFDYRGWGESEGPRGRLFPSEQVEDIRHTLTFLAAQDGVDPERLALYGTSLGGANVVQATAADGRVRCTVASLAIGHGERWLRSLRSAAEWDAFAAALEADRRARAATGTSRLLKAFEVVPPSPRIRALMEAAAQSGVFTGDEASVTAESAEAIMRFVPEAVVASIAPRPILFIHAGDDDLVSPDEARSLYARAGEPKELIILPGVTHVDFYLGDALEQVTAAALGWFQRYVPPGANLLSSSQERAGVR